MRKLPPGSCGLLRAEEVTELERQLAEEAAKLATANAAMTAAKKASDEDRAKVLRRQFFFHPGKPVQRNLGPGWEN